MPYIVAFSVNGHWMQQVKVVVIKNATDKEDAKEQAYNMLKMFPLHEVKLLGIKCIDEDCIIGLNP